MFQVESGAPIGGTDSGFDYYCEEGIR